jgi:hypothetical protein
MELNNKWKPNFLFCVQSSLKLRIIEKQASSLDSGGVRIIFKEWIIVRMWPEAPAYKQHNKYICIRLEVKVNVHVAIFRSYSVSEYL